jgi:hypothetical protein
MKLRPGMKRQAIMIASSVAFASTAVVAGGATEATTAAPQRIAVHTGYYVTAGRAFDDLDAVERFVRSTKPHALDITSCEPGASRALLAAAHRFRDLALNLQVLDAATPACTAAAAVVGPSGINDAQVEAYWKQVMP